MFNIDLTYLLSSQPSQRNRIRNSLIEMLEAIERLGSLSAAARELNMSYRYFWGEMKRWEDELGQQLVVSHQGRAAELSALAKKLLWAEHQIQARHSLQIEGLRASIEQAFAAACDPSASILSFSGCFDPSLALLREEIRSEKILLDLRYSSSRQGLEDLKNQRCVIAGFNVPVNCPSTCSAAKKFAPLMQPDTLTMWHYAARTQGLAVARGNPLGIHSLIDVARKKVRYVNRKEGTGTRLVFDELIHQSGISENSIIGFDRTEPSHVAVATAIACGDADAGLCIEIEAVRQGLDFVPLVIENYYFAMRKEQAMLPEYLRVKAVLCSQRWKEQLTAFAGYCSQDSGETVDIYKALPWW